MTFSAIFEDFMKANANVLYQFALGASYPIEHEVLRPASAVHQESESAPGPPTANPSKENHDLTDEEIDNILVTMVNRAKVSYHSEQFEKRAQKRVKLPPPILRKKLSELEASGRIPAQPIP
jgi:hypothetical protein